MKSGTFCVVLCVYKPAKINVAVVGEILHHPMYKALCFERMAKQVTAATLPLPPLKQNDATKTLLAWRYLFPGTC